MRPTHSCLSWFRTCERASLITLEDNNSDGRIQYTGPAPDVENELTIDRDIMVLANPEIARLPDWVIGLVAVSFFSAIIMGIFSCRMNKEGAVSGMVVGITFYAACVFYFKFLHPDLNPGEQWWWGISPEGIGIVGMLLNFATALLVSRSPRNHRAAWSRWSNASTSRAVPKRRTRSRSDCGGVVTWTARL